MTLEWHQLPTKEICHVTACGRYSVAFDGQHSVWRSYRLAPGGPWFVAMLPTQASEDEAKAFCQRDCR